MCSENYISPYKRDVKGVWLNRSFLLLKSKEKTDFRHEIFTWYDSIVEVFVNQNTPANWSAISVFEKSKNELITYYEHMSIDRFIGRANSHGYVFRKIQNNLAINLKMVNRKSFSCHKLYIDDLEYNVSSYFKPVVKEALLLIGDE